MALQNVLVTAAPPCNLFDGALMEALVGLTFEAEEISFKKTFVYRISGKTFRETLLRLQPKLYRDLELNNPMFLQLPHFQLTLDCCKVVEMQSKRPKSLRTAAA